VPPRLEVYSRWASLCLRQLPSSTQSPPRTGHSTGQTIARGADVPTAVVGMYAPFGVVGVNHATICMPWAVIVVQRHVADPTLGAYIATTCVATYAPPAHCRRRTSTISSVAYAAGVCRAGAKGADRWRLPGGMCRSSQERHYHHEHCRNQGLIPQAGRFPLFPGGPICVFAASIPTRTCARDGRSGLRPRHERLRRSVGGHLPLFKS